jgi:hypothetical protein
VSKGRVLRGICGPKSVEVTVERRRQHKKELNEFHSPNIIWVIRSRRMGWAGHVAHVGDRRGAYRVLVERIEGKRPLRRPGHRWEDNIKTDLEVGWGTRLMWHRIGTGGRLL